MVDSNLTGGVSPAFLGQFINEDLYLVSDTLEYWDTVVLIERPGDLPHNDEKLLTNILNAIKISPEKVKIINLMGKKHENFTELEDITTKVIAFGVHQQWLPANTAYHDLKQIGKLTLLRTLPLDDLNRDDSQKKKLWACLKKMYWMQES